MRTRLSSVAIIVAVAGVAASPAFAGVEVAITTVSFTGQIFAPGGFTSIEPFVSYGHPQLVLPPAFMGNQGLTALDFLNGTVVNLTGDFAGFSAFATNGLLDLMFVGFGAPLAEPVINTNGETAVYNGPNVTPPDLEGWLLSRISVMGTSLQTANVGAGTVVIATVEFTFWGTPVPAPGAAAVIGLGVVGVAARRRR